MIKSAQELRDVLKNEGAQALAQEIVNLRRQLFELRLNVVTSHVRDYVTRQRALRAAIARALTIQHEQNGGAYGV